MPFRIRKRSHISGVQCVYFVPLLRQSIRLQAVGVKSGLTVIRDANVIVTKFAGALAHLPEGVKAVAVGGVHVQDTDQVVVYNELGAWRQQSRIGLFAQFRHDKCRIGLFKNIFFAAQPPEFIEYERGGSKRLHKCFRTRQAEQF